MVYRWGWSAWLEEHLLHQLSRLVHPTTQAKLNINKRAACFLTRDHTLPLTHPVT